jgi:hypothetical protein
MEFLSKERVIDHRAIGGCAGQCRRRRGDSHIADQTPDCERALKNEDEIVWL